jgi:hypothetical protein
MLHIILKISQLQYAPSEFINLWLVGPYLELMSLMYQDFIKDLIEICIEAMDAKKEFKSTYTPKASIVQKKYIDAHLYCELYIVPLQFNIS